MGKPLSAAHKAAISAGLKRYWAGKGHKMNKKQKAGIAKRAAEERRRRLRGVGRAN